jgi:UDP-glucose 4-epimerase
LFEKIAPKHQPQMTLPQSIARLKQGLESVGFADGNFRNSSLMRLRSLEQHMVNGTLKADLHWVRNN